MKPIRRLPAEYSSPYGRVHNPNITTKPKIYIGGGVPLSSVCAGHMVIGEPELCVKKSKTTIKRVYEGIVKEFIAMALWRKNMQIPQSKRERKKKARREKREIPLNSFYIFGTGKTPSEYVESPENRRLAGINQQDD